MAGGLQTYATPLGEVTKFNVGVIGVKFLAHGNNNRTGRHWALNLRPFDHQANAPTTGHIAISIYTINLFMFMIIIL